MAHIDPPPGCFFVESPTHKAYMAAPPMLRPESNVRNFEYYSYSDLYGWSQLQPFQLGALVRDPDVEACFLHNSQVLGFYMQPKGTIGLNLMAAHLPNTNDVVWDVPEAFVVFLRWWLDNMDCGELQVMPDWASMILDPKVRLEHSGEIHLIRCAQRYQLKLATYTTSYHCMRVIERMSRMVIRIKMLTVINRHSTFKRYKINVLDFTGQVHESDGETFLPFHTPLVVWNCKGAARESFIPNFHQIMNMHQPKLVILLETRCYGNMFRMIHNKLDSGMRWVSADCQGISGGVAMLWDEDVLSIQPGIAREGEECQLNTLVKVRQHDSTVIISYNKYFKVCSYIIIK